MPINVTNRIQLRVQQINNTYMRVNRPYATFTHASALREVFGEQMYKNNGRALLLHTLSIVNSDLLQQVSRSVHGLYKWVICSTL